MITNAYIPDGVTFNFNLHNKFWLAISELPKEYIHPAKLPLIEYLESINKLTKNEADIIRNSKNFCLACEYARIVYDLNKHNYRSMPKKDMCYFCPFELSISNVLNETCLKGYYHTVMKSCFMIRYQYCDMSIMKMYHIYRYRKYARKIANFPVDIRIPIS